MLRDVEVEKPVTRLLWPIIFNFESKLYSTYCQSINLAIYPGNILLFFNDISIGFFMRNLLSLEGKVALITGASQGQGAAEAELFAEFGANVVLTDVLDNAGRMNATKLNMPYLHLDVSKEEHWAHAVQETIKLFGQLDILVNNAGISHFSKISKSDLNDFQRISEINTMGIFLGMKHAHFYMKNTGGSIINVASIAGLTGRAGLSLYSSSKWAIRGLSRSASLEYASENIRVNTVFPGLIDTPMTRQSYSEERILDRGKRLPLGRLGTPEDVGNLALFLASDASSFITGGEFVVDGGETAGQRIS